MSVRRIVIGVAVAVGLVAGAGWWLLSSGWVARRVIAFALGRSAAGVTIADVRGRLRGPLILRGIRYRSGGLSAEVDSVFLDWRPRSLLHRRIELDRLDVTGVRVAMSDSAPRDTIGIARRERPNPPLPILLGQVRVRGIEVDGMNKVIVRAGTLDLDGAAENYRFTMTGTARLPQVPRLPPVILRIAGRGDLERIRIERTDGRVLDGSVAGAGTVRWWPRIDWNLALGVDRLRPGLWLDDPSALPGWITAYAGTRGAAERSGLAGTAVVDSSRGRIQNRPIEGAAEIRFAPGRYDLARLEATWGPAAIEASGRIGDTLSLRYRIDVRDLGAARAGARGSVSLDGTASGPAATALVHAEIEGRRVGFRAVGIERLSGHADVGLAPDGRLEGDIRGEGARAGSRPLGRIILALRGTRPSHRLNAVLAGERDSVRLGVAGGLHGRSWAGTIDTTRIVTAAAGNWDLVHPARIEASSEAARLDSLCLLADSAGGRACAAGQWRAGAASNGFVTVDAVPLTRMSAIAFDRFAGGRAAFGGTLGLRLDARSSGDRLDATLRATSDTVSFRYRDQGDTVERKLRLDSAVVEVKADPTGLLATLGFRVQDDAGKEVAVLEGRGTVPRYRLGKPFTGLGLSARLDGRVDSLSFARPLLTGIDSLGGSVVVHLTAAGRVDAPALDGTVSVDRLMAGVRGRSALAGSVELAVKGGADPHRVLSGEARLTPTDLTYSYRRAGQWRRVVVDSGGVRVTAGAGGARAELGLRVIDPDSAAVGTVAGHLTLPRYTRWGRISPAEPMTMRVVADLPRLGVVEPWLPSIDSLGGRLHLELAGEGRLGSPTLTGTVAIDSLSGRLAFGPRLHGGADGDLHVVVAGDSTIHGTLALAARGLALEYPEGTRAEVVRFDSTALRVDAGPNGIRGRLDVTFMGSRAPFGTLKGTLALPRYTRFGRPLGPEPVVATLTGRIDDLGFIESFTRQVDSAAGRVTLDAKLDGTLAESHLTGAFTMRDVVARLPVLGIVVDSLELTATGDQAGSVAVDGRMRSGGGTLTIKGSTPVQPTTARPGRIQVDGTRFEAVHNAQVHAIVSPRLVVRLAGDTIGVRGEIDLPVAAVTLTEIPEFAVPPSDDVVLIDSLNPRPPPRPLSARLHLRLGDSVTFKGFNFDARFGGDLVATQRPGRLATATGTLTIEEGRYKAYGQDLTIEDGQIRFAGGPVDNPGLSIRAQRTAQDSVQAGLAITGTLKQPVVTLYSTPTMSQSQVLSYIVRGRPLGQGAGASGTLIGRALSSLGLRGGNVLAGAVGEDIGLDEARLETEGSLRDAAFVAGRYLSPNVYISYGIGLFDPVSTLRLRYVLSNRFTFQAETGRETSADILIKTEGGRRRPPR